MAKRQRPSIVLVDAVTLYARIQHFAKWLDHRVRHGDVQVASGPVEIDAESGDDHNLRGTDNVGEVRVHFRSDFFNHQWRDMRPGFLQIAKRLLQDIRDNLVFNRGEFPALDLRMTALAAEVDVDQ